MRSQERIIELRRDGNRFIVAADPDQDGDVYDEHWYRDYIATHCQAEEHEVDLFGANAKRSVFVSKDDGDVAFCLLDQGEAASNFDIKPTLATFVNQHVRQYTSSETFYEPYRLFVQSQILPSPLYRVDRLNQHQHASQQPERVSPDEALNSHYSIVIGAPGIGKTTYVRHLAQQLLERNLRSESRHAPILISLRKFDYADFNPESLQHYLRAHESEEIAHLVNDNLEGGLFRFFLDGLDEVQLDRRNDVYQGILAFSRSYPLNAFTITARDSVFESLPDYADVFRLGDWDDFLVRRWCYENLKDQNSWKDFYSNVVQNTDDKDVFRNPLMLNLAAYLFEQYNMLPHRKVDLFYNVINAIVDDWDKARGIRRSIGLWNSPRHKLNILAYIAYQQFASGTDVVSENTIQQWIGDRTSTAVPGMCRLLAVETGLLTEEGDGKWSFVHKSIQEYLAAVFIADSSSRPLELLNKLHSEQRSRLLAYISNMVSNNTEFVEQILNERAIVELEKGEILTTALAEGMELNSRLKGRVYELVGQYLRHKFEIALKIEIVGKRLSVVANTVDAAKGVGDVLYMIAKLGRTKFGDEFRDVAKAVLPKALFSLINFVLKSSAFFITAGKDQRRIEGRNETTTDFSEK